MSADDKTATAAAGPGLSEGLGLVERLRLRYPETPHHRDALHREAADEIERLRAALELRRDWQPPPKMPTWPERA